MIVRYVTMDIYVLVFWHCLPHGAGIDGVKRGPARELTGCQTAVTSA